MRRQFSERVEKMTNTHETSLISLHNATKRYGKLVALNNVSVELHPGEVAAIVGKNGSGKSTLIKILSGVIQPDEGEMMLGTEPANFKTPSDALDAGVVTVHQELSVIESLTVAENIVLGRWPKTQCFAGRIDHSEMNRTAKSILAELDEEQIDVRALVSSLSVAERQIVETARALVQRPKILLLDEPFSTLSGQEVEIMSRRIHAIAQRGLAVAFVTHRLGEVKEIATTVMVLRDGDLITKANSADISVEKVAQLMLGEAAEQQREDTAKSIRDFSDADVALSLRNFSVPGRIENLDLDVRSGEIVGIAGLLGAGRSEFLRALVGVEPCTYDTYELYGENIEKPQLNEMIRRGVYLVPEERKVDGFVGQFSVMENLELPNFSSRSLFGHIQWRNVRKTSQNIVERMSVKISDLSESIENLSGGNQQKVVLGRWIKRGNMRLFLLDEPSRGVDIHARMQILEVIRDLAEQGIAVLMVASEFEELFEVCDRLVLVGREREAVSVPTHQTSLEAVTAQLLRQ
ncbi:sugar ABC transporter ATP-binding protein [Paracoccaceae bacterium GXU_MW_L88]